MIQPFSFSNSYVILISGGLSSANSPLITMPIKRPQLANNETYHIVLRGVGDSLIFKDENDYYRAIFSLFEFNTVEPIEVRKQRERRKTIKVNGGLSSADTRDMLVDILAFCFMPNHIHLWLKQMKDNGITRFMRKFGTGYASYFNKKYSRKGHLFQGRFQAVHVKTNEQFQNLFVYIHTNPISLVEPKWKEKGITNQREVIKFLENYRWSSYSDYIGKKNFSSVTERNFVLDVMGGKLGCKNFIEDWVKFKGEITGLNEVELE